MNCFLKTRQEISDCTKYLQDNGLQESGLSCKNWDAANVLPYLRDGNILDMGSDGSIILENAVRKNIVGVKVGIDLAYKENYSSNGIDYIKGDLCNVPFPDGFFNYISSLSVLEHEINHEKFVKECSRLLSKYGELFVSFDYSPEKIDTSSTKLYSLSWNILSKEDVVKLIKLCAENDLIISGEVDWTLSDMVITPSYCSPSNCSYTFGVFRFLKK